MNLLNYLDEHFSGLALSLPLFYKWPIGIRFELNGDVEKISPPNDSYFAAVSKRANLLYEDTFRTTDYLLMVTAQRKIIDWSRDAIQFRCRPLRKKQPDLFRLSRKAHWGLSRPAGKQTFIDLEDSTSREVVTLRWSEATPKRIRYSSFLEAIANQDFPNRWPQCTGEVFFIDPSKHIIMNMYDDRGMDVITNSSDALRELYTTHNKWILDYDREKIEQVFSPSTE